MSKNKIIYIVRKLRGSVWACGSYYRNMSQVLLFSSIQDLLIDFLAIVHKHS